MGRKLILFELNEVPWRVVDEFCDRFPDSTLARLLPRMSQVRTHAEDSGHLSPWTTWPSLHRGVTGDRHFIQDFGQDLSEVDAEFPPVWRLLSAAGVRTGVCGSLHSYPLPDDHEQYAFYIPDTFAAGAECFPKSVEPYQEFNLLMARESARNVTARVPWASALRFLAAAPGLGLRASTAVDVAGQLVAERTNPWRRVRRRTYQVVLAFDVFMKQLERTRPDFATFFTNHVASSMHRYWAARFPEDYEEFDFEDEWVSTFGNEIDFTMKKFDGFLARLAKLVETHDDTDLWITTSMGQAATVAQSVSTQLYATDVPRLMSALGLESGDWTRLPCMLPQLNVRVTDAKVGHVKTALDGLQVDGRTVVYRESANGGFSIDFGHLDLAPDTGVTLGGETVSLEGLGLSNVEIEDKSGTTAYHVPEGCLLAYDPRNGAAAGRDTRPEMSSLEVAPAILERFGVSRPDYMRASPARALGPHR